LADLPVLPPQSRLRRNAAEKVLIFKESLVSKVSIAAVALAHSINANKLQKWRGQYR
jgi:transposase-like protein